MNTRILATLVATLLVTSLAQAEDKQSQAQPAAGKTRAEVIAEMQAARAAGQLNKPDYYPVFEGSWPGTKAQVAK